MYKQSLGRCHTEPLKYVLKAWEQKNKKQKKKCSEHQVNQHEMSTRWKDLRSAKASFVLWGPRASRLVTDVGKRGKSTKKKQKHKKNLQMCLCVFLCDVHVGSEHQLENEAWKPARKMLTRAKRPITFREFPWNLHSVIQLGVFFGFLWALKAALKKNGV